MNTEMHTLMSDLFGVFDEARDDVWRGDATSIIEFLRPLRE